MEPICEIKRPSVNEVQYYIKKPLDEHYIYHDEALNLAIMEYPDNKDIASILIKATLLNNFYSTNILSIYPVAKHIANLDIDNRLKHGDLTLVNEIAKVNINGVTRKFYSFASKYCFIHQPKLYPIYDSFVEKCLIHFRNQDKFSNFKNADLKNYEIFYKVIKDFILFYDLNEFDVKKIDRYLWLLGKKIKQRKTKYENTKHR